MSSMPAYKVGGYPITLGWLLALAVALVCVIFFIVGTEEMTREWIAGLILALAVARLVP